MTTGFAHRLDFIARALFFLAFDRVTVSFRLLGDSQLAFQKRFMAAFVAGIG